MTKCKECGGTGWAKAPPVVRKFEDGPQEAVEYSAVVRCHVCSGGPAPVPDVPPPFIDDKRKAAGESS